MFSNSLLYLSSSIIVLLLNFLTLPFFTSYLTLSDYGIMALFLLFGNLATSLLSFGLNTGVYRFYFKNNNKEFQLLSNTIIFFLLIVFLLSFLFIVNPFAAWISENIFNFALSASLIKISFLNGCLSFFYLFFIQIFIAKEKAKLISILYIIHALVNLSISTYLILFQSMTFYALIYGIISANMLLLLITLFYNYRDIKLKFSLKKLRRVIRFSYPETISLVLSALITSFDRTMLANYKSTTDVGNYEFGNKFSSIMRIISEAIKRSWSPFFMINAEKKTRDSLSDIVDKFYIIFLIIATLTLCVSYFSEEALIILTTEEFHVAKWIVPVFGFQIFAGTISYLSVNQIMVSEKLLINLPLTFLALILNIILNLILIPEYGVFGAAYATTISGILHHLTLFYFAQKFFPLPLNYRKMSMLIIFVLFYLFLGYLCMYINDFFIIKILLKIFLIMMFLLTVLLFGYFKFSDILENIRSMKFLMKYIK